MLTTMSHGILDKLPGFLEGGHRGLQIDGLEAQEAPVDPHQIVVDLGQVALDGQVSRLGLDSKQDWRRTRGCFSVVQAGSHGPDVQVDGRDVVPEH